MTDKKKIDEWKNEYENIEIPDELDLIVRKTIKETTGEQKAVVKENLIMKINKTGVVAACVLALFTGAVNISPAFAESLSDVPILGSVVKVLNIRNYVINENGFEANISVPEVSGLGDEELEKILNEKFIEEGQKQYDEFINEMEFIKSQGREGHMSLQTDYKVKTDNDGVFSMVYTKFEAIGSSDTQYKSYTIDKKNKAVVSLKSLFKDNSYVEIISDYIKEEMRNQMKEDENKVYFIDSTEIPESNFECIDDNQNFYINDDGKLVILFDKYEAAPGYMGSLEFIIPTEILLEDLLPRDLIK